MAKTVTRHILHECSQADNIRAIKEELKEMQEEMLAIKPKVDMVYHCLEGNGQKGMREVVVLLSANVAELSSQIQESKKDRMELRDYIVRLTQFKTGVETTFKDKKEYEVEEEVKKVHLRWLITTIIALVLGIVTLIVAVKKEKNEINRLRNTIEQSK